MTPQALERGNAIQAILAGIERRLVNFDTTPIQNPYDVDPNLVAAQRTELRRAIVAKRGALQAEFDAL